MKLKNVPQDITTMYVRRIAAAGDAQNQDTAAPR